MSGNNNTNKNNDTVITRIPPYSYIHVIDKNDNVTRLLTGPKSFVRQEHEKIVLNVTPMVKLNSQQYCLITNPVVKDEEGQIKIDKYGQAQLKYGDLEYRFFQDPFPLYPGEVMKLPPTKMKIVLSDKALILKAEYDFVDVNGEKRISGDKWLFKGPATYIPNKAVEVVEEISAVEVKPNTAIKLRALKEGADSTGTMRYFGEEWLVKKAGAYMLSPYESLINVVEAINLDEYTSLRVRALRTHTDEFGKHRKHGSEWLITHKDTESHIPSVFEEVVERIEAITLNNRQYCVILNPVDENFVPQNGKKKLIKGDCSFFLQPGEVLENGRVNDNYILSENEALILKAIENVQDHKAGEKWMIRGPLDYVPPVEVEVIDRRSAIPLDANEGIYVRNVKTGKIRSVTGETYILTQDEELWEKDLPMDVRKLLAKKQDPLADRGYQSVNAKVMQSKAKQQNTFGEDEMEYLDSTRVVTYRVPHNAAVQIYDFKAKKARIEFGPDLVMLDPEEQFTMLSISGGKPKRPNVIKSICLLLGPDFCTDVITVETADHARLSLQLSYNWHFEVTDKMSQEDASKLFSVPDFIGDSCKAIASRIRGNVASVQFDDFHKNSAKIIRSSVFGYDENKKIRDSFRFPQNNLVITSIDVQSVEPVDQRTRDALQKSVQLAIEITTNSQEANARHEAERLEQEARGRLERQKLEDEAAAEKSRMELLQLQVQSTIVESTGQAKAEAKARAEAARIEGEMAVESAELKNKAMDIEAQGELGRLKEAREAELIYLKEKDEIEILRKAKMAELDTNKFTSMIKTLGAENLKAIASAGPDQDVRMLKALGLQSTLITDGATPINLLQTAHGLIGSAMGATTKKSFEPTDIVSTEGNKRTRRESVDLD